MANWDDNKVPNDDFASQDWDDMVLDQKSRSKVYTGSGTPVGSQTPEAIGDLYVDTDTDSAYIATGATSADWELIDVSVISWGAITGTLTDQTDLDTALGLKYDATDFNTDWDARLSAKSTTDLSEGTNLYYTEIRVAANSAVFANTSKVTNATHTGDVTGSAALTIAAEKVTEAMLKATNAPTDNYILSYDLGTLGFTWIAPSTGDVSKTGTPVDNQLAVWTADGIIEGTVNLTYDGSNLQLTGDIGSTGSRITKAWLTDLAVTNAIAGSITGNAATVSTISGLAPDTATTQATQAAITTMANLVTVGALDSGSITSNFGSINVGVSAIEGGVITAATNFAGDITGNVTGNCSGSAGTVATISGLAPDTATTQATQAAITSAANLATVGTIGTGAWEATDIGISHGGTGQSTAQAAIDALSDVAGGTNEHVLTKDTGTGNAIWKASAAGFTDPMTTRGDLIYKNAAAATVRLGAGTVGQVLTSDGTDISWAAATGGGDVSKVGTPVDNQVGVWTGDGTIEGAADFTYDGSNFLMTGDIGSTGSRITKGWFTDLAVTNAIAGSITGNAATVSTITGLAPDTATTQATQAAITSAANLVTIGTVTSGGLGTGAVLGGVTMTLGSDADGDIYYRTGNVLTRLAKGTAGQVLAMNGGATAPEWIAAGGGGGAAATFERTYTGNVGTGRLMPISIPDELIGLDIKEVRLSLLGLPTGSALTVDVRKSGTATTDSIFTSDVEIEVGTGESATNGVYTTGCDVSGATVGTPGTTIDAAKDTLSADDILWVYITAVGSTISGADLLVTISVA